MSILLFQPDGSDQPLTPAEFYTRLEQARGQIAHPFSPERIELVASVGAQIMKTPGVSPFVTHFAFWIRTAAIRKIEDGFNACIPPQSHARARGLVFHLPPQNVETVFLYSWILAYLSGNANIVRLPAELSAEMRQICTLFIRKLHESGDFSQLFVHYPSSGSISHDVSKISDARIVWGGTAKVNLFSAVPLRNGGKSIWFGDRFSFCMMQGDSLNALNDKDIHDLAQKFYNDIFIFDQMACSSPHVLYVVGKEAESLPAMRKLLAELAAVARAKENIPATGHVITKMVEAMASAATGDASSVHWADNELTHIVAASPTRQEARVGGGFLRVAFVDSLAELQHLVREHDQTITYFGFPRDEIDAAVQTLSGFGVTRVVPVGAALDFDSIWDGYNIPFELVRLVRVT